MLQSQPTMTAKRQCCPSIHPSFHLHMWTVHVPGARDTAMNKTNKVPAFLGLML